MNRPRPRAAVTCFAACFMLVALLAAPPAGATPVRELVRKADLVARGKTSAAVFEMHVKTRAFERKMRIVAWDTSRGKERTLIKILGPALWRGYGTLKVGSQLKLFNPKNNHVTVVGHSMLGDSWMGSHFTNDDLVKETQLARHYRVKLRKKWKGPAPGGSATHYLVSLTPKPTAPVAWGRIDYHLWVRGKVVIPVKASYFRKAKDRKAKRAMTFGQVKKLGGRTLPATMTVRVASKPGEFTRITYRKLKLNIKIPDRKFTEQALRK